MKSSVVKIFSMIVVSSISAAQVVPTTPAPSFGGIAPGVRFTTPVVVGEFFGLSPAPSNGGGAYAMPVPFAGRLAELYEPGDQDDPGYATYKKGYNLILEEKWEDARKVLGEVSTKFPKSKYVDDAQYWIAYSLKYSDKKKSIEAYKKFLKQYQDSNYYDDAVADLNRLENPNIGSTVGNGFGENLNAVVAGAQAAAREARAAVRALSPMPAIPPMGRFSGSRNTEKDPELRMKIEALYALGRSNQDEKTFELLKETALNREQPLELREAALNMLRNFKGHDVSAFYMELLNDDSDERLQQTALYGLGQMGGDSNEKTFSILKGIALDRSRPREIREAAFYSLSQLKRSDVVDIFVEIAKNDPDKRLQQTALYYVGRSSRKGDEEKAFQVLKEFALDQKQNREIREAAFNSLRETRKADALNIYLEIAKNDPDERMKSSALYSIGQAGERDPEKVFAIYKEFLLDQKQSSNVREAAIHSLTNLKHPETLNLFLLVAKSDPDERIQQTAIYYIGQLSKNKAKNLETLISLYDSMPKERTRSLESVIYAVASIGNDQAVDFLGKVAKTSENYDIRRRAVYYLGNIGGDKARAVLLEILKAK